MIGESLGEARRKTNSISKQRYVLRIEHLTVEKEGRNCIQDLSLSLARGEVLGIYGLLGAGRTELLEALIGQRRESNGRVFVNDRLLNGVATSACIRNGICLVPEDRQRDGVIP